MARQGRSSYETATWRADFALTGGRRGAARQYKAFIPDPVADLDAALDGATAALSERAGAAVRDLNASAPKVVSLEGLARQLLRSEALASSRIEGLNLSHRKLAQAELEGQGHHKALEVLGNIRAMEKGVQIGTSADLLSSSDITEIHRALAIVPPLDKIAGQIREEQGWIGGADPPDADYVGPPHEHLPRLLDDLCLFMNRDDVSPVAQAAIAHAQFELIHPFGDGNGRVGRCLIHVLFRRRGLSPRYVPPVSLILGANKDAYIAGLNNFQADHIDDWVAQFARATETAALKAEDFSEQISQLQEDWRNRLGNVRSDAVSLAILEHLPTFPFITTKVVHELTGRSDVAALRGLTQLEKAKIVTRHRNKRKGDRWEAKELFELLNEFEQEVRLP